MTTDRPERVATALAARELDLLLVSDLVNLRWLTGFTGSSGAAVVGVGGDRVTRRFLTDFRYLSQSEAQLDATWKREIVQDLLEAAAAGLPTEGATRLGFDDEHVSVKQHAKLQRLVPDSVELVGAGGLVEDLRMIKDAEEVARIRAAALLADAALESVLRRGLAGRTEQDVAFDLETEMRRMGAQGPSFPSIVASGAHGALPHAVPRDVEIPEGVLVTIDWGAQLDGYASDCTRTYATGAISDGDRDIYELVQRAQAAGLAAVRPGPTGREVDAVARAVIDEAGHAEHFGHGLGHGVGMEVHEGPRLSRQGGDVVLAAGHIVTVEPGVYVPGQAGVRIEDLVAVTPDGHDVLSTLPKVLTIVH
jgi:Xaa-Pro aminopeptidase